MTDIYLTLNLKLNSNLKKIYSLLRQYTDWFTKYTGLCNVYKFTDFSTDGSATGLDLPLGLL